MQITLMSDMPSLLNNGKANRRDAKIFEDDVNGGKMRMGMENGHLYYEEL